MECCKKRGGRRAARSTKNKHIASMHKGRKSTAVRRPATSSPLRASVFQNESARCHDRDDLPGGLRYNPLPNALFPARIVCFPETRNKCSRICRSAKQSLRGRRRSTESAKVTCLSGLHGVRAVTLNALPMAAAQAPFSGVVKGRSGRVLQLCVCTNAK